MWKRIWSALCFLPRLLFESIGIARKYEALCSKLAKAVKDKEPDGENQKLIDLLDGRSDLLSQLKKETRWWQFRVFGKKSEAARLNKELTELLEKKAELAQNKKETEPNGGVNMESVLRPRKNTTREIRRLWRDEAVLELLKNLGGRALSTNMNVAAQKFGWRFRVRTHLRRLESYGLVKSGVARGSGGVAILNWRIVEVGA